MRAISEQGGTPLAVAERTASGGARLLGVIHLKDIVKTGFRDRFADLRAMGIRTARTDGGERGDQGHRPGHVLLRELVPDDPERQRQPPPPMP